MHKIRDIFARSEESEQSQNRHGHLNTSGTATSLRNSRTSAHIQGKGAHGITPQSSTNKAMTPKERELSKELQVKEAEIVELQARYKDEASRKMHEIQNLLHDRISLRGALEKKDSDMRKISNSFRGRLDEKERDIEELRGCYDKLLHAHESQHRNSKTHQRNADAEARELLEKLMTAEQELDMCRDDLFRTQPVCWTSDRNIIDVFESLVEQLINWIDNETSAFEKANPDAQVGCLFFGTKDTDVERFLQTNLAAGEYFCRHMINRYLVDHMFGSNIHQLGLSAEYTHMRLTIEHGMAALEPPRGTRALLSVFLTVVLCLNISDSQSINIWRAETMSALAATQEYTDLRDTQVFQWTWDLFQSLSAIFPNLFRGEAVQRFHHQVTMPATTMVSKLQGLASAYSFDMVRSTLFNWQPLTRDDLKKVIAIDFETGKTLKPSRATVSDREGVIGVFILPLEPSLYRMNEGVGDTSLRQATWLVKVDHA